MYKHVALLVRKDGMSHEEFREHWEETHSPLAKDIEGVVRYQTVYPNDPDNTEFDGIAELYFETLDDLHEALGSEGSRDYDPTREVAAEAREDVNNFLDVERRPRFIGEEKVWKDEVDGETDGLYKHSAFLVRKDGMSHEEFREHWEETHSPLAKDIEGVVRYQTVYPNDPDNTEFDGIAELYFETLDDLHEALGSEGSRDYDPTREVAAEAREDVNNFLDVERRPRFIGEEKVWKDEVDGETDGLYKHSAFLVRKDGMSHEEFREHWEETHSPLAKDIEGVVRYQTVYPNDPDNTEFDGIAELYFETLDDLHEALGSEGSRDYDPTREVAAEAREDVNNFLDVERRPRFIGEEKVWKNEIGDVDGY